MQAKSFEEDVVDLAALGATADDRGVQLPLWSVDDVRARNLKKPHSLSATGLLCRR
jgi:hypothetical protein